MPTNSFATKPNIEPLADRVLIENLPPVEAPPPPGELVKIDGVYVAANSRAAQDAAARERKSSDSYLVSRVLAIGAACKLVKVGQKILFARHHAGVNPKIGDTESTFIKETDIIAVMK